MNGDPLAELDAESTRRPGRSLRRRLGILGLLLVVFVLLLAGLRAVAYERFGIGFFARPFDRERWLAEDPADPHARRWRRQAMVQNLIKSHLHPGMSRAEAEALIGPPDADPFLSPPREGDWLYMLASTPLEQLKVLVPGRDVGYLAEIVTLRALVVSFDERGSIARIEILER